MKIGVGVCSYKRPKECLSVCDGILNTVDTKKHEYTFICAIDQEDMSEYGEVKKIFPCINGKNSGVAVNKNRALRHLSNCDLVFLFEDDFKPIKRGWVDIYLRAINESGMQHYNFILPAYREKLLHTIRTASLTFNFYLRNCGVFMVMTKKVIDTVGAFDERYGKYGFEHCDYTRRCKIAKLCFPEHHDCHPFIVESDSYFQDLNVKSTVSEEEWKKYTEAANKVYLDFDPKRIYVPF